MKVYTKLEELQNLDHCILTIGSFDGLHLGHQALIQKVVHLAYTSNTSSAMLTFHPHPRAILGKDEKPVELITTMKERMRRLEKLHLDHLAIIPFTRDLSEMQPLAYVEKYIVKAFNPKRVVIGFDHRFGYQRSGDATLLARLGKAYSFDVDIIDAQKITELKISSTRIREALANGEISVANTLLGYPFELEGIVVHGEKRGRRLDYPTANLLLQDSKKIIPKPGVYWGIAEIQGNKHCCMINIGHRPTYDNGILKIEVHVLDWQGDLYGSSLSVSLMERVRDERAFENTEALQKQLQSDEALCRARYTEILGSR